MDRLCAICGTRSAELLDEIDERTYPVCRQCCEDEVPEPPPQPGMRERILSALRRSDAMDIQELAGALGEDDDRGRAKVSAALNRAVRVGLVSFSGRVMDREYSLGADPGSRKQC